MPFTFSHSAAILPIYNKWGKYFSFTALVLGSMAPDFEYFLHFRPLSTIGHNISGFFILNLPLCFVIAYLFHKIIKKPLILHLPIQLANWVGGYTLKNWRLRSFREVLAFIYSALLGMLAHVIWDSFTHVEGEMVKLLPSLSYRFYIAGYSIALFKLLQHASTIFGAIIIFLYLCKNKSPAKFKYKASAGQKILYVAMVILLGMIFSFCVIYFYFGGLANINIGIFIITIINCVFIGVVLASIVSRIWIKRCLNTYNY